jgi:hypothetical protein
VTLSKKKKVPFLLDDVNNNCSIVHNLLVSLVGGQQTTSWKVNEFCTSVLIMISGKLNTPQPFS